MPNTYYDIQSNNEIFKLMIATHTNTTKVTTMLKDTNITSQHTNVTGT